MFWKKNKSIIEETKADDQKSLVVEHLTMTIQSQGKDYPALCDVNFQILPGQIVGLVGESGCGKSLTSLAVMGLLPNAAKLKTGKVLLNGLNLCSMSEKERCALQGAKVSMIFQDPMSALNPLRSVGKQIAESYRIHHKLASKKEAKDKVLAMMEKVGLPHVSQLYKEYPHQLSGGMKQRVMIAMALINEPDLIIADEPTTALDVTIQAQILDLLKKLNEESNAMILLISHDLGVIRSVCSQVMVMYGGMIVEQGEVQKILHNPIHPYTKGLLSSIPDPDKKEQDIACIPGYVESLEQRKQKGCPFAGRCQEVVKDCKEYCPKLQNVYDRQVRCGVYGGSFDEGK